jgi:flagellar basal body-associated protein FliL
MAQNLINEIEPGRLAKVGGQTEGGLDLENSEDAKTGVASASDANVGEVFSNGPTREGISEWRELIGAEDGAEGLEPSWAEDTESGSDDSPANTVVEASDQSEKRGFLSKHKKVIAGLVLVLFICLVVCGVKRWHMHAKGDHKRATSTLVYRAPITRASADILDLAGFVVLLAENEDRAYLSLSISVKLSNSHVHKEMEQKKTFFRGVVYRVLDKAAKAGSPRMISKEQLKRDIISALNGLLVTGAVDDIYFSKYLVV